MAALITELLNTPDTYETVRDLIGAILAVEIANQQTLATAASEDPNLYRVDTYVERSFPVERWLNSDDSRYPLVNVWWQSLNEHSGTSTVDHQQDQGTYFLDFEATGVDEDDLSTGHIAGDYKSRTELHRAIRLVRQILMSGQYTYLSSPRKGSQFVFGRSVRSIVVNEPEYVRDDRSAQWVATARMTFDVRLKMAAPQVQGVNLELITNTVTRDGDGKVLARANIDLTA